MTSAKHRVLNFPEESVGYLYKVDCFGEIHRHEYGVNVGSAQGSVEVDLDDGWMLQLILTSSKTNCLKHLSPDSLESLGIIYSAPGVDDDDLTSIGHLTSLRELFLESNRISSKGLDNLNQLSRLEVLTILSTQISNSSITRISKHFPNLRQLSLAEANINDEQLSHLSTLPLEILHLGGTKVSDAGLESLGKIRSLKRLILYQTNVTGIGLDSLKDLTNLHVLILSETAVNADGIANLTMLPQLKDLNLYDCKKLNDQALAPLSRLSGLSELTLNNSGMSEATIEKLRVLLPNCKIWT